MKRKHLALLLAAAMTVTSVDATALVSAADFSAEVTDEAAVQEEDYDDQTQCIENTASGYQV